MTCADTMEHPGLYRSRNRLIFGVCAGFAEYMNLSVFWMRVLTLGAFICTGLWPVGALYLLAALMMKRSPYARRRCGHQRTYEERARKTFDSMDQRLRRMEEKVMHKARDWDRRLYED